MPERPDCDLPDYLTTHKRGSLYERWDTIPENHASLNSRYPPPKYARKPLEQKDNQNGDDDGDVPMPDASEDKGIPNMKKIDESDETDEDSGDESDGSEPGCFDDHIRDGEGWNRRMRKISLAWWRINKNQKTLDVETEPKLDVYDDPLVRYLKSLNESSENWEEEQKIVMGMARVLKTCGGRNHVSKALVAEIARISDDEEKKEKIAEVLYTLFFFTIL